MQCILCDEYFCDMCNTPAVKRFFCDACHFPYAMYSLWEVKSFLLHMCNKHPAVKRSVAHSQKYFTENTLHKGSGKHHKKALYSRSVALPSSQRIHCIWQASQKSALQQECDEILHREYM